MSASKFFVGLDLGQSRDFTALAVVEQGELAGVALRLRHIERIPLGTSYPEVVDRVAAVMGTDPLRGRSDLIVDATGVGRPVVDLLQRRGLACWIRPVMVTSGQRESFEGGYYGVPKRDLIIGLQVLLQQNTLKIAAGLEFGAALLNEMAEMRVKMTSSGNEQFGSWREGTHDDLVFAVALACWGVGKGSVGEVSGGRLL